MKLYSFSKKEHLCSHKLIEQLFQGSFSFVCYPFRLVWMYNNEMEDNIYAKVGISVSKRNFKKAVDRNTIKRKIREAYRLNKLEFCKLLNEENKKVVFMLIYIGKDLPEYQLVEKKMIKAFKNFKKEISSKPDCTAQNTLK